MTKTCCLDCDNQLCTVNCRTNERIRATIGCTGKGSCYGDCLLFKKGEGSP